MSTVRRLVVVASLVPLGACHTLPIVPRSALQLISSVPLQLPADCSANGSVRIDFVVEASGSTSNIAIPAAPACLQRALSTWVASFKYSPLPQAQPSSVEWLLVSA